MSRASWVATLSALAALAIGACSVVPSGGPMVRLENGTSLPVAVHMNGAWVGTYPPGAVVDVPIGGAAIPVVIEARSPSGAALVSFTATESDVVGSTGGAGESVLPCGSIRLSMSTVDLGPLHTPESDLPGACP